MTAHRYSLKCALAACRGALTTVRRARRRYAPLDAIDDRLWLVQQQLCAAEFELRVAVRDALNEQGRKSKSRRAAA